MLYIRTDMNHTIATGHMMRCLSIADALRKLGEDITFILADGQAAELLLKRGYPYIILNTYWNDMEAELCELQNIIKREKIEKLLIDSYQVTERYLSCVKELVKVIYIDDINAFTYPADMLICYANYWKKFDYEHRYRNTQLLLGTGYVPLRAEFQHCGKKQMNEEIKKILILSGGTDKYHVMLGLLERLERKGYESIHVICGKYYTEYEALCQKYQNEENVHIQKAVSDIERYMKEADLAVSAGGTTLYELCAAGTPTISFSFAENQLNNVIQFAQDGIIDYAGDARNEDVIGQILLLLENCSLKRRMEKSAMMQVLVDGLGAERIAEEILRM